MVFFFYFFFFFFFFFFLLIPPNEEILTVAQRDDLYRGFVLPGGQFPLARGLLDVPLKDW